MRSCSLPSPGAVAIRCRAVAAKKSTELAASRADMARRQPRRRGGVALARGGEDTTVLCVGAGLAAGQRQLHPHVSLALVVKVLHQCQRATAPRRREEHRMKCPVELGPLADAPLAEGLVVAGQHISRVTKMVTGDARDRAP